jgi:hypothetical protein
MRGQDGGMQAVLAFQAHRVDAPREARKQAKMAEDVHDSAGLAVLVLGVLLIGAGFVDVNERLRGRYAGRLVMTVLVKPSRGNSLQGDE